MEKLLLSIYNNSKNQSCSEGQATHTIIRTYSIQEGIIYLLIQVI